MRTLTIFIITILFLSTACNKVPNSYEEKSITWELRSKLSAGYLSAAVSFVINNKLYVGLGMQDNTTDIFYEYDYDTDQWKSIKNFPTKRTNAIGFSVGNYGYAGFGVNYVDEGFPWLTAVYYNDLWKYDPQNDTWTKMTDFPGKAQSTCFVIGNNAYVTGGSYAGLDNELWEYNATLNAWTKKANYPGGCSSRGISFSIGNKGYVGFGWSGFVMKSFNDLWEYDPINNTWTQKADFPGKPRYNSKSAAFLDHALLFCGVFQDSYHRKYLNDIWIYDPIINGWSQADTCYVGKGQSEMILNVVENHILVGLGIDSMEKRNDELWQYNLILK
jgi:N-acetylneuraminic acid mutarotase